MSYETISDARTAVKNSGVENWRWGPEYEGREDDVLNALATYLRVGGWELNDTSLAGFVRHVLGDYPSEYDLPDDQIAESNAGHTSSTRAVKKARAEL